MPELFAADNSDSNGEFAQYVMSSETEARLSRVEDAQTNWFEVTGPNGQRDTNIPVATIELQCLGSRKAGLQVLTSALVEALKDSSLQFTSAQLTGDTYQYMSPALEHVINKKGLRVVNERAVRALFAKGGDIFESATSVSSLKLALTNALTNAASASENSVGFRLYLYVDVRMQNAGRSTHAARFYYTLEFVMDP